MKENSDLAAQIWDIVDRLLSGNYTVEEFRPKYEALYQGEEANNLSKEDEKIFSDISYKLDFTHFNPDPQSISDGYINHSQFIDWLREYRCMDNAIFSTEQAKPEPRAFQGAGDRKN